MSKKRRRKRKLKPFAKVLFTFTIILLLAGGTYYIYKDSSSQNINKDNISNKDNNQNINKDSNDSDDSDIIIKTNEEIPEGIDKDDYVGILEYKSQNDYRYKEVVASKDIYPEKLLEMLSRNDDMISYMYDYKDKEGNVYIDNVGKVTKGEIGRAHV